MPKVNPGESRNDFVARCIPVVMKEGLTQDQAVGKCEGMYDSHVNKSLETARTGLVRGLVRKAADASRQIAKARLPEGSIRQRSDGRYQKQNGAWVRIPDKTTPQSNAGGPAGRPAPSAGGKPAQGAPEAPAREFYSLADKPQRSQYGLDLSANKITALIQAGDLEGAMSAAEEYGGRAPEYVRDVVAFNKVKGKLGFFDPMSRGRSAAADYARSQGRNPGVTPPKPEPKPTLTQEQMKQAIAGAHRGGLTPEQLGQLAQHLKDTHEIK